VKNLAQSSSPREASSVTLLSGTVHLGLISIEQNAIIKVFSIAAVLFLPPTLVSTL